MLWSEVEITKNDGKVLKGGAARKFVEQNCSDAGVETVGTNSIRVTSPITKTKSVNPSDVRLVLFTALRGKVKSLRVLAGGQTDRIDFPVAKAVPNVVNVIPPRLKVEFFYKQDPKSSSPRKYLEDSVVTVKALREGDPAAKTMPTTKGIADFDVVAPGNYTITPDYSALKECEYDWTVETRNVVLKPGSVEVVEFQVEPLYQKVQFIAHALLTIPKQVYFPETEIDVPERTDQVWQKITKKFRSQKIPAHKERVPHYWKAKYNGYLDDEDDIKARVKIVKETIKLSHQKANPDPKILKIFAIPECYFQGKYGAYETDNVSRLLDLLQDAVKDEIWKDWIFVFGTINGSDIFAKFDALGKIIDGESRGSDVFNISPVIKGGHGDSDITAYRRLIQKAFFSAELIDASSLIPEPGLKRAPVVNPAVAFQPTENETILGEVIRNLLTYPTADQLGIADWATLKDRVKLDVATPQGMTKVVRNVREGANPELKDALGKYIDRMASHPKAWTMPGPGSGAPVKLSVQPDVLTPTPNKDFNLVLTLLATSNMMGIATENIDTFITVTSPAGDEVKLTATIAAGESSDDSLSYKPVAAGRYYLTVVDGAGAFPPNKSSFFVFSRDLLEQTGGNFDYRDYVFACARKAGPWLDLSAAEPLQPCKKMVFGLEICADHNQQRLLRSLETKHAGTTPTIDIQLIPSAGMYPADTNIAARTGGYVFNCDGWNCPSSQAEKMRQGLGKFVAVTLNGEEVITDGLVTNPKTLYPHTMLSKAGSPTETRGFADAAEVVRKDVLETVLDKSVIDLIFGEGAGELHVYQPQDLPK